MGLFDSYKRRIRYKLFKKKSNFFKNFKNERFKVLFFANGGIGDILSSICYIERFYAHLDEPQIDFLVHTNRKQIVLDFFGEKTPPFLNAIYSRQDLDWKSSSKYIKKEYDLFVELCGYVPLYYLNHPKTIRKRCPKFLNLFEKYKMATADLMAGHLKRPHYDGHFAQVAVYKNLNRKSFLGHLGQIPIENNTYIPLMPHPKNLEILKELGLENQDYITLHSGSDIVYEVKDNLTTKQWPVKNYETLIQTIKAHYPSLKIVYLKGPNSSDIKGAHITLETSFSNLLWVLKFSKCHIDCESGLVRIARELHCRSVVIFGPTNYEFFKLDENENLKPNICGNCFWLDKDWQTKCMKGFKEPPCIGSISVESVFKAFEKIYLKHDSHSSFHLTENVQSPQNLYSLLKEKPLKVAVLLQDENDFDQDLPSCHKVDYFWVGNSLKENLLKKIFSKERKNLSLAFGSLYNLPCKSAHYDLLVCDLNLDDPYIEYALKESLRALKTKGELKITFKGVMDFKEIRKLNLLKNPDINIEKTGASLKIPHYFEKLNQYKKVRHNR